MLICMRTTLDINDEILRQAKKNAADENTSLKEIVERALREHLGKKHKTKQRYKLRWHPEAGRLQRGIDLDDRDSLLDTMEGLR